MWNWAHMDEHNILLCLLPQVDQFEHDNEWKHALATHKENGRNKQKKKKFHQMWTQDTPFWRWGQEKYFIWHIYIWHK